MFVRFRETPYGLQVSLIQTRREGGKARHEHIAGLGAITIPTSDSGRGHAAEAPCRERCDQRGVARFSA